MKLVIVGLGNFGRQVAIEMSRAGHDVLAMDRREEPVQAVRDQVNRAVAAEIKDRQVLGELGVAGSGAAVVSLGQNMAGSILATLFLKELEVNRIIVKALDDDHAEVLKRVGADQAIFPEREMAERLAQTLAYPNVIDYLPLGPEWAILEVKAPAGLAGQSLRDLDLRRKLGIQVLAVKKGGRFQPVVDPDLIIRGGDILVVMGKPEAVERLREGA